MGFMRAPLNVIKNIKAHWMYAWASLEHECRAIGVCDLRAMYLIDREY